MADTSDREYTEVLRRLDVLESQYQFLLKRQTDLETLVVKLAKSQGHGVGCCVRAEQSGSPAGVTIAGSSETKAFSTENMNRGINLSKPPTWADSDYISGRRRNEITKGIEAARDAAGAYLPEAKITLVDARGCWNGWYDLFIADQHSRLSKKQGKPIPFPASPEMIKKVIACCSRNQACPPNTHFLEGLYTQVQPMLRPGGFRGIKDYETWDDIPIDTCINVMFYHENKNLAPWWTMSPASYSVYLDVLGTSFTEETWGPKIVGRSYDNWDLISGAMLQVCEYICMSPGYPYYRTMTPKEFVVYIHRHPIFSVD